MNIIFSPPDITQAGIGAMFKTAFAVLGKNYD